MAGSSALEVVKDLLTIARRTETRLLDVQAAVKRLELILQDEEQAKAKPEPQGCKR